MAARRQLLHTRVVDEIRGLDPGRTEIVELVRQSELNMCCRCWQSSSCYCTMSPFPCLALSCLRLEQDAAISSNCVRTSSISTVRSSARARISYSEWSL
jgi:hypothetical protein